MSKRIALIVPEKIQAKLEFIMDYLGEENMSQAIKYSIIQTYEKLQGPAYVRVKNTKPEEEQELPEDRLKRQIEQKKEKARLELLVQQKAQMDLAQQLYEPVFEETPNGDTKVTWPVFEKYGNKVISGSIGKMLSDIYPLHIEGQFKGGTREEIIKLLKKQTK